MSKLESALSALDAAMGRVDLKKKSEKFASGYRKTINLPVGLKDPIELLNRIQTRDGNNTTFNDVLKAGLFYMLKWVGALDATWDEEVEKWLNRAAVVKETIAQAAESK